MSEILLELFTGATGKQILYTGEFNDCGSVVSKRALLQTIDIVYLDNMITEERTQNREEEACVALKAVRALVCAFNFHTFSQFCFFFQRVSASHIGIATTVFRL